MNWECSEEYLNQETGVEQEAKQISKETQKIEELVVVKDSCDVTVVITDKQFALSLQAALQAAIVVILQVHLNQQEKADEVSQELFQLAKIKQITKQKFYVSHSKNVYIESTDQQAAANIQILVQLLLAVVKKFSI
ncbi:MAG: spore coat protein [Bacillales bacterium]|jgi:spore coat protein X|nr:spore coat protein [Bacillales bacterium]